MKIEDLKVEQALDLLYYIDQTMDHDLTDEENAPRLALIALTNIPQLRKEISILNELLEKDILKFILNMSALEKYLSTLPDDVINQITKRSNET